MNAYWKSLLSLAFIAWFSYSPASFAQNHSEALPNVQSYVTDMRPQEGLLSLYHDEAEGRFYLQVPIDDSQYILQTSLPWGLGSNDIGLDRGQLGDTHLVSFTVEGRKALLVKHNTKFRTDGADQAEQASVDQAFADSVLWGFDVVARNAESVLIDYTPFLMSDTHGVVQRLVQTDQGDYQLDSSRSIIYPERTRAFPDNIELEAKVTYVGEARGAYVQDVAADARALTLHLHHSFIRLPDDKFEPRTFHPNSGYWAHSYENYAAELGEDMTVQYIPRHRFSADEPIIYYLDPGAPEPVRSALLDGARWWQEAFAALGFENGFQVKLLPEGADPMDVRYNVIQWVHRATRGWSYGASVIDPRTGEILKGHVTLGSLRVRQDMLIAEGLLQPFQSDQQQQAELVQTVEAMALARIRQLSAHEIGHTLGIAHNFAASANDRASVMDYPHPMVSISTDGEGLELTQAYTTGLGVWDKQVIAYGYGNGDDQALATVLRENRALGLQFISDRDARSPAGSHPDGHLWDNGSDAVTELERVLDVREEAMHRFGLTALADGKPLSQLHNVFVPVYAMHRYQTEAAVKMLGGSIYSYYVKGEDDIDYRPVNGRQQQLALRGLLRTLQPKTLTVPKSIRRLLVPLAYGESPDRELFKGRTGLEPDPLSMAEALANHSLTLLLNPARLNRLSQQHQWHDGIPSIASLVEQVLDSAADTDENLVAERVTYVALFQLHQTLNNSVTAPEVRHELQDAVQAWLNNDSKAVWQPYVDAIVQRQSWPDSHFEPLPLPPGSPI